MKRRTNLLLLALVLVCLLSLAFGRLGGNSGPNKPTGAVAESRETIQRPPAVLTGESSIHVLVLNGTPVRGLARETGLALALAGCVAEGVANAPHDHFERTLLINRRLDPGRARDFARRLGGVPLIEEKDPRREEDIVLVLGADHEAVAEALAATAED